MRVAVWRYSNDLLGASGLQRWKQSQPKPVLTFTLSEPRLSPYCEDTARETSDFSGLTGYCVQTKRFSDFLGDSGRICGRTTICLQILNTFKVKVKFIQNKVLCHLKSCCFSINRHLHHHHASTGSRGACRGLHTQEGALLSLPARKEPLLKAPSRVFYLKALFTRALSVMCSSLLLCLPPLALRHAAPAFPDSSLLSHCRNNCCDT